MWIGQLGAPLGTVAVHSAKLTAPLIPTLVSTLRYTRETVILGVVELIVLLIPSPRLVLLGESLIMIMLLLELLWFVVCDVGCDRNLSRDRGSNQ